MELAAGLLLHGGGSKGGRGRTVLIRPLHGLDGKDSILRLLYHGFHLGGGFQLSDAVVVGLDQFPGDGDPLTGGGVGALGGVPVLGVVETAQLRVGLLDTALLSQIGCFQLGDLRQALGRGDAGLCQMLGGGGAALSQIGGDFSQIIQKPHNRYLLIDTVSSGLAPF